MNKNNNMPIVENKTPSRTVMGLFHFSWAETVVIGPFWDLSILSVLLVRVVWSTDGFIRSLSMYLVSLTYLVLLVHRSLSMYIVLLVHRSLSMYLVLLVHRSLSMYLVLLVHRSLSMYLVSLMYFGVSTCVIFFTAKFNVLNSNNLFLRPSYERFQKEKITKNKGFSPYFNNYILPFLSLVRSLPGKVVMVTRNHFGVLR